ncbi:hypothetical protein IAQ61_005216 [Plenodomus lingam]|uniref:uncharacterized protein n=1 Tax=Leptosphaeria maculans TaxID=5022 RepID=UPI0033217F56|nr:hypothetical protein IAQ61_005216 [Plenodomus lingam]
MFASTTGDPQCSTSLLTANFPGELRSTRVVFCLALSLLLNQDDVANTTIPRMQGLLITNQGVNTNELGISNA